MKPNSRTPDVSDREAAASPADVLSEWSDHSLLQLVREGRDEAAAELYRRYAPKLRMLAGSQLSNRLARRVNPDDIVQSVFKSFFRRTVEGLYDVPQHEELWGLLLVSALNKIRSKGSYFGAAKRDLKKSVSVEDVPELANHESGTIALVDLKLAIEDGLARLPESYRSVIERRIAGEEIGEIAMAVKLSLIHI